MTVESPDPVTAQAIAWHVRLRHGGDDDWAQFLAWLEQDPAHAAAYERIEAADQAVEPILPAIHFRESANDDANDEGAPVAGGTIHRRWRWPLAGGLIAASLVAALLLGPQLASGRYEVTTAPGEHRVIALDAGTRLELNGSTRITLDRANPRFVALHAGEELFHVRHDAARPFTLDMDGREVVDLGTVFDVVRDVGGVRLAVAEGKVAYRPAGQSVTLGAGQALSDAQGEGTIRVTPAAPGSVGGWRSGHLVYAGAPLSQVAGDLARTLGLRVTVAPGLADRLVSGTIALNGKGPEEARRIGAVLDVAVVTEPDGWTLRASGR